MNRDALGPVDEVEAGGEVAPLIAAARLQRAAVAAVELEEIHALQDLVAELGVADALVGTQSRADGVLRQHPVDPEMLADVTQQVDRRQLRRPVEVVHHDRGVFGAFADEVEERLDLALDAFDPGADDLRIVELALGRVLRVADEAGRTADKRERPVTGVLKTPQRQDLHKIAKMQTRRRRVESAVIRDRAGVHCLTQRIEIGADGDQATPGEIVEDVRIAELCHAPNPCACPLGFADGFDGRRLRACARYADTVGSPSSQKRHGTVAPAETPTRGPALMAPSTAAGRGRIRRSEDGSQASAPLSGRPTPSATVSRAGPRARSRAGVSPRRRAATSRPSTTSPARNNTADAVPAGSQTRFMQKCMP